MTRLQEIRTAIKEFCADNNIECPKLAGKGINTSYLEITFEDLKRQHEESVANLEAFKAEQKSLQSQRERQLRDEYEAQKAREYEAELEATREYDEQQSAKAEMREMIEEFCHRHNLEVPGLYGVGMDFVYLEGVLSDLEARVATAKAKQNEIRKARKQAFISSKKANKREAIARRAKALDTLVRTGSFKTAAKQAQSEIRSYDKVVSLLAFQPKRLAA